MNKILKITLLVLAIFLFSIKSVSAYYPQDAGGGWEDAVYGKRDEFNLQSSTNETFKNLIISANQAILGPENPEYQVMVGGGAIASVGNLIASMYANPPASSIIYFADVLHNLGIAKPAYAQGVGFVGMSNLLPLWKAFRNFAYILFIIAFLYIGLAIMFRVKISPQAVVTIQNALPKLIIALILVTFSYAIVGLMIDLIYLIISLVIMALNASGLISNLAATKGQYLNLNFPQGILLIFNGYTKGIGNILSETIFSNFFGQLGFAILTIKTGFMALLLPVLILSCLFLYLIFKLFISLLTSYIQIIFSVIFAPLYLMASVFPGSKLSFGSWFSGLLANILVFPAVVIIILISSILIDKTGPTWVPPLLVSGAFFPALLSFGSLLVLHKVPDAVKAAFKIKPGVFESAVGESIGVGYKVGQMAWNKIDEPGQIEKQAKVKARVEQIVRERNPEIRPER